MCGEKHVHISGIEKHQQYDDKDRQRADDISAQPSGRSHGFHFAAQTDALVDGIGDVLEDDSEIAADLTLDHDCGANQIEIGILGSGDQSGEAGLERHAILRFTIDAHELAGDRLLHFVGDALHRGLKGLPNPKRIADDRQRVGKLCSKQRKAFIALDGNPRDGRRSADDDKPDAETR
ncbi:hypothetical protein SDC9_155492 [bioreactor metagenome]|uniref:Uncharacterized protein n=1 Tax=bioreactor metagenome TaxID=1076179 RepID=A0A645F314_9ZZZZ